MINKYFFKQYVRKNIVQGSDERFIEVLREVVEVLFTEVSLGFYEVRRTDFRRLGQHDHSRSVA